MPVTKERFIRDYANYLREGSGGVFVGAGISTGAGYPTWKALVKDMADELELDLDKEPDLPSVVQYFLNTKGQTRTHLTKVINREVGEKRPVPRTLRILARLPVRYVWTTNYDHLIERAFEEAKKQVDAKSRQADLSQENPFAHVVLYKMHGTIDHPTEVVIAKSDIELFRRTRRGFHDLLTAHLISRHLLFLGFSFTDPNVGHLFALIRESFESNPPEHFAIVRKPQKATEGNEEENQRKFEYERRRHKLWVEDLQTYGIHCVEIDQFKEIDELLAAVEHRLSMDSVMISGSFPDTARPEDLPERTKLERVAQGVGRLVVERKHRLVSGFGLTVGSAALSGALDQLYKQGAPNLERSLYLRPFPQIIPDGQERQAYYQRYREDLVSHAGVCIYVSGMKDEPVPGKVGEFARVEAGGVVREFEIATRLGRVPIPVGATGGAAATIWTTVNADRGMYHLGGLPQADFDALNAGGATPEELVIAVGRVLKWIHDHPPVAAPAAA